MLVCVSKLAAFSIDDDPLAIIVRCSDEQRVHLGQSTLILVVPIVLIVVVVEGKVVVILYQS